VEVAVVVVGKGEEVPGGGVTRTRPVEPGHE